MDPASVLEKRLLILSITIFIIIAALFLFFVGLRLIFAPIPIIIMLLFIRILIKSRVETSNLSIMKKDCKISQTVFFILVTSIFILLTVREDPYQRPSLVFPLFGLLAATIGYQIYYQVGPNITTFNTVVLSVLIIWTQFLMYPSSFGIDPQFHHGISHTIANTGLVPSSSYSFMPLYHILLGSMEIVSSMSFKNLSFIMVAFSAIAFAFILRGIIEIFVKEPKSVGYSLLLLYGSAPFLLMLLLQIPNFFIYINSMLCIYVLMKMNSSRHYLIIMAILFLPILGFHATAAAYTLIAMVTISLFSTKNSLRSHQTRALLILLLALTAYWNYSDLIHVFVQKAVSGFSFSVDSQISTGTTAPIIEEIFNSLPVYAFFSLSSIGLIRFFSNGGLSRAYTIGVLCVVGLALVGFINIDPSRSLVLAGLLVAPTIGISFSFLISLFSTKTVPIIIIITVFLLVTTSSMIPITNYDNREFLPNKSISYALTEPELVGGAFSTDRGYGPIFTDVLYEYSTQYIHGSFARQTNFSNEEINNARVLFLRNYVTENPSYVRGGPADPFRELPALLSTSEYNKLYDNGHVWHYAKPP